jgi:hypothetical protein
MQPKGWPVHLLDMPGRVQRRKNIGDTSEHLGREPLSIVIGEKALQAFVAKTLDHQALVTCSAT